MSKATSTKGVKICISPATLATPVDVTPSAITKAKPAVMTVSSSSVTNGQLIVIPAGGTGFPELDGKTWVASAASATSITLLGSDTTGSTGTLAGTPVVHAVDSVEETCLCLSVFSIANQSPAKIDVGTFCDASATLLSQKVEAPSLTLGGFVDITSADYIELLKAETDGLSRNIKVTLPQNGYLVGEMIVGSIGWELPLDGAQQFTIEAQLASKFRHLF